MEPLTAHTVFMEGLNDPDIRTFVKDLANRRAFAITIDDMAEEATRFERNAKDIKRVMLQRRLYTAELGDSSGGRKAGTHSSSCTVEERRQI